MSSDSTLDEIEGPGWSDPDFPSAMVQRIRALGRVPLRAFTAEDYRLIITQQRALGTLVPLALDLLQTEPFAEGAYHPGDLLLAVIKVDQHFWQAHPDLRSHARRVLAAAIARLDELEQEDRADTEPDLRAAYEAL
jgi:hypothetical protein